MLSEAEKRLQILSAVRRDSATFESEATKVLSRFETSTRARVVSVLDTKAELQSLSLKQQQLFAESLECISFGIYRPAIVSAFQAYVDCLDLELSHDGMAKLRAAYPNWNKYKDLSDLRENVTEYDRIQAARKLGIINKSEMKAVHGYLSIRNDCAHPSNYRPNLNSALGIVSDLIDRAGEMRRNNGADS